MQQHKSLVLSPVHSWPLRLLVWRSADQTWDLKQQIPHLVIFALSHKDDDWKSHATVSRNKWASSFFQFMIPYMQRTGWKCLSSFLKIWRLATGGADGGRLWSDVKVMTNWCVLCLPFTKMQVLSPALKPSLCSARTQKLPTCRGWTCLRENPLLNAGWRFATGAAVSVYSVVGDIRLVKAMTGWYRVMTEQQVISTTQISDLYRTFQLSYHKRRIYNF